jgi:hypothetical protein
LKRREQSPVRVRLQIAGDRQDLAKVGSLIAFRQALGEQDQPAIISAARKDVLAPKESIEIYVRWEDFTRLEEVRQDRERSLDGLLVVGIHDAEELLAQNRLGLTIPEDQIQHFVGSSVALLTHLVEEVVRPSRVCHGISA